MKKVFLILVATLTLSVVSCTTNPKLTTISGTITSIENGKDGYTAVVLTKDGQEYHAVISKINLAKEDTYKRFDAGDAVVLKGESWDSGEEHYLTVRELAE